jgi:mono/diheme cytochrome c family protein
MRTIRVRRLKIILLLSSVTFLAFLLLAAFEENFTAEWRGHQSAYAAQLTQLAKSSGKPNIPFPLEVRQVYLEGLKKVDRCVTCHVAIDDPRFTEAAQPLATHSGDLLKHHPSDKFGCTICHQGQGRATAKADAHGHVPHWPEPMLGGAMVYTSCSRCHYENDLYGGQSDLYGTVRPIEHITEGELASALPHADNIARGKRMVVEKGCLGCHKYRGRGGKLGPDITYVGDKTAHGFDFKHVHGEHTVENWLFAHFKSPTAVVPNTLMPDLKLSDAEARDLAAYMISLKHKSAPAAYTPLPQLVDSTPVRGETLYKTYCSSCHGADGIGAIVRDAEAAKFFTPTSGGESDSISLLRAVLIDRPRELLTPSLRNVDTLGIASDAYLRHVIAHGRTNTSMLGWKADGGLSDDEVELLVGFIRRWEPNEADRSFVSASRGEPRIGGALYRANCSGCHGLNGEGGQIGISLRAPGFLAIVSDDMLAETILRGRANTAMPAWRQFDNRDVSDLLAFIRSWQPLRSNREEVLAMLNEKAAANDLGAEVGDLSSAAKRRRTLAGGASPRSDVKLDAEAPEGRHSNSPRQSSVALSGLDDLFTDITGGLRPRLNSFATSWLTQGTDSNPALRGNFRDKEKYQPSVATGLKLYRSRCTVCHGENGEGKIGPSINNQAVLSVVSNEFLHDTIVRGRPGTAMPAWRQLSSEDVADVIALLRSWQTQPSKELPDVRVQGDRQNGESLFTGMCASCHGPHAEGALGPQLSNAVFLDTVNDATLTQWISFGRPATQMRPHLRGQQGNADLSKSQIEDIVTFLRSLRGRQAIDGERIGLGYAPRGAVLYREMCVSCHGTQGEGTVGPAIRNPAFLHAASDGFLRATIVLGRDGTEMRSMSHRGSGIVELKAAEIDDLIAYLRSNEDRTEISHRFVMGAQPERGKEGYAAFCAGCHGDNGKEGFAPQLNNPGFLRAATDGYLQATIIRGRRGTAMRAFGLSGHGLANLNQSDINDIVAFIRQWSPDTRPLRRTEP